MPAPHRAKRRHVPSPSPYSKAFESLVRGDDDLVGLLAYALYKKNIREAMAVGQSVHRAGDRLPTATEITAYRGDAERRLIAFAESAIDQAKPDLIESGVRAAMLDTKRGIEALIRERTSIGSSVIANVVGWLVSIGITVLVVVAGVPSWIARLAAALGGN